MINRRETAQHASLRRRIERAAAAVGPVWPLHAFVAANPLSDLEDLPFSEAVREAERLLGARGYPRAGVFRTAWERGEIRPDVLRRRLKAHGFTQPPGELLACMEADEQKAPDTITGSAPSRLDRVLSKWLAAFLDQGQAQWPMPHRERGFYAAWRELAPYDAQVPHRERLHDLPHEPLEAIQTVLDAHPEDRWEAILERHLTALPGWTGLIKQQARARHDPWQEAHPITLVDYLAVRLTLADLLGETEAPPEAATPVRGRHDPLPEIWLRAWEESYRDRVLDAMARAMADREGKASNGNPAAQLVFCIDTRSEIVRRHIERVGPYETHGYAGFFGIPMRFQAHGAAVEANACPPIVDPKHRITERVDAGMQKRADLHDGWSNLVRAGARHLNSLKSNVVAAFNFVEGAGSVYGAAMAVRTLLPSAVRRLTTAIGALVPDPSEFCAPALDHQPTNGAVGQLQEGMTLEEKADYAEAAFRLMGWREFAPVVVFVGHASETTNNPFAASLDCGACAGNPGGANARVLAAICNDDAVRSALAQRDIQVPPDTFFLAGEHNTTTDEVRLFANDVPEDHAPRVARLRKHLDEARAGATAERVEALPAEDPTDSVRETARRAVDWAETRPEWGLAGNASFVIGPRRLTEGVDLNGRAFLHSYDWTADPDGDALEAIMTGPLVVTQWINHQYYFASVDNSVHGSGSKTTQNPVGNIGVVQGNGGDLMTGLPLQSLQAGPGPARHKPLRLTAIIHAPVERVESVLRRHADLAKLLNNGWIGVTVVDPGQDNAALHYERPMTWARDRVLKPTATPRVTAVRGDGTE